MTSADGLRLNPADQNFCRQQQYTSRVTSSHSHHKTEAIASIRNKYLKNGTIYDSANKAKSLRTEK
jgi:hypothetical protein